MLVVARVALLVFVALGAAACGGSSPETPAAQASSATDAGETSSESRGPDTEAADTEPVSNEGQLATVQVGGETHDFHGQACSPMSNALVFVGFGEDPEDAFEISAFEEGVEHEIELTLDGVLYTGVTIGTMDVSVSDLRAAGSFTFEAPEPGIATFVVTC